MKRMLLLSIGLLAGFPAVIQGQEMVYSGWRYGWYNPAHGHPGSNYETPARTAVYSPQTFQQYPFYGLTPNGTLVFTGGGYTGAYYRPEGYFPARQYQMGTGQRWNSGASVPQRHSRHFRRR